MSKRNYESTKENQKGDKRYRPTFSNKKLEVGMKGFFISFDRGKQRFCQTNTFKLLNHYGDILYGPENPEPTESDGDCSDVEASLKLEVDNVKNSVKSTKKRFSLIKTGCSNLIFVKTYKLVPSKLIKEIVKTISECESLKSSKIPIIRDVLRVHAVDFSCSARLPDIKAAASKFLPEILKSFLESEPNVTKEYAISCNRRFNNELSSIQAIEEIVEGLSDVDPSWNYNCRSTEIVILVEVIKSFCGVSVAPNYYKYKKFNIRELMNSKSEKHAKTHEVQASEVKPASVQAEDDDTKTVKEEIFENSIENTKANIIDTKPTSASATSVSI